jgi:Xaa-Pro aminopeptidase
MKKIITEIIASLRKIMERESLDAIYLAGTDPHMSEYLCDHWQTRQYVTGFTGSFGEVVITRDHAGLWTDTRYFLQAEEQLKGTGVSLHKLRVSGAVPAVSWMLLNLPEGARLGIDPYSTPLSVCRMFEEVLTERKISIEYTPWLIDEVWTDRPELPQNPVREISEEITGETRKSKLLRIINKLADNGAQLTVITALDDLAWSFNLRGTDVRFNPVFMGYAIIGDSKKVIFLNKDALSGEALENLLQEDIEIYPYDYVYEYLKTVSGYTIFLDPSTVNTAVWNILHERNVLRMGTSIPALLKSVKNKTELNGFRKAMINDGIAMVKFMKWLSEITHTGKISEYHAALKLTELRTHQPGFMGESFAPIVGYKDHGAVVHLTADSITAYTLKPEGILLFDSGGHYETGTTDITRTVALGPVSEQQKSDFTLVLKGMIALTMAVFPAGTKGMHLDILARQALWKEYLNYGHGTGHGVGHFLNVHEGPATIRQEVNQHEIRPGMVFSNEPGIYRTGEYGIRIENMIVCVEKKENEFGTFYGFETLTLCPVDTALIMPDMLSASETDWLNTYHSEVRDKLTPLLSGELITFLEQLTKPL